MGSLQQAPGAAQDPLPDQKQAPAHEPELKAAFNNRYEILSELGRGAMGVVYKAHDREIGRTVALKTIAIGRDAPDHDEIIQRLKSEAKAAGSLDHPNIITIYDVGHDGDRVYLSMQFVEGSTLATILDGKNLLPGPLTLLSYAEQICNALAFAHERGVIHRDLKPSNLMLTPQGQIKVLDFGIAKKGDASLTQYGMVVGTPSYMAPEQATGKEVDNRADIFALGAVFYELFTGKKAFGADTVTAVLYKVVHETSEPPSMVNPAVPPGVDAAIRRALEKDPAARFQNCTELRDILRKEAVLLRTSSAKILTKPLLESGNHPRITGRTRSKRLLPAMLVVVFLLAIAGVVVWPQRAKIPQLARVIAFAKQFRTARQSNAANAAVPVAQPTGTVQPPVKTEEAATSTAVTPTTAEGTAKPEPSPQDPALTQTAPVATPTTTSASSDLASAKNVQHDAAAPASTPAANIASPVTPANKEIASKEIKTEPPASNAAADPGDDAANDPQTSNATADASDVSAPVKRIRPAAPSVVEGFTRKDIPDLLRKADASAGSGDYKSARYSYDIVLRLDRQNARARDGLRRAREAEKERR